MKNKQSGCIIINCCLFFTYACAQQPITVPKNEYGLNVVSNINTYKKTILSDSNKTMVLLKHYISPLITDFKYATVNNFTKTILYNHPVALVRLPVAKALQKAQRELQQKGLTLKFFDAYRPYAVTKKMWAVIPDERYAVNPAKGSGHNRGAAVDVTLVDLHSGKELPMPTAFDDFTEKAHHDYMHLDSLVIANRTLLKTIMEKYGFVALETEWWHYSLPDAAIKFELLDIDFSLFLITNKGNAICNGDAIDLSFNGNNIKWNTGETSQLVSVLQGMLENVVRLRTELNVFYADLFSITLFFFQTLIIIKRYDDSSFGFALCFFTWRPAAIRSCSISE